MYAGWSFQFRILNEDFAVSEGIISFILQNQPENRFESKDSHFFPKLRQRFNQQELARL